MNAKKAVLILFILALGVISANAQLSLGVKAGFNTSNFSGLETSGYVNYENPYKPGFNVGLAAQYMFTPQVGIESGLYYSLLGAKQQYKESLGNIVSVSLTETNSPSYLQLPVSVLYKFAVGRDLYLYPSAGIYVGYGIAGKTKIETDVSSLLVDGSVDGESNFFGEDEDGEEYTNRLDAGLTFGLNLQYSKFVIGLGYDLGLTKINKESYSDSKDIKNVNIKVSLGYFF
ncbi:MAG: PorT family protein [Candidatus Symbiothrix sp.]|jgi:hypothetical protein|nr:PorT family protein [Candidatus Symbiothrix sp.]